MNTLTVSQIIQNTDLLFADYGKEPLFLKNENNQVVLILPFSSDNLGEIFLALYKVFDQLQKENSPQQPKPKIAATDFFNKWHGFMKDVQLADNWRDERVDYLMEKHK